MTGWKEMRRIARGTAGGERQPTRSNGLANKCVNLQLGCGCATTPLLHVWSALCTARQESEGEYRERERT
eukprot:2852141-Pleurochrysis_carterae.AAC.3